MVIRPARTSAHRMFEQRRLGRLSGAPAIQIIAEDGGDAAVLIACHFGMPGRNASNLQRSRSAGARTSKNLRTIAAATITRIGVHLRRSRAEDRSISRTLLLVTSWRLKTTLATVASVLWSSFLNNSVVVIERSITNDRSSTSSL